MVQINPFLDREMLEAQRQHRVLEDWELPRPQLSLGLRESAGNLLIALGSWIKPSHPRAQFAIPQTRLAGR